MIRIQKTSIFESDKKTLVNPVCSFPLVKAGGLARDFGIRYPRVHDNWQRMMTTWQTSNPNELASPHLFESHIWYYDKSLLFFPTKIDPYKPSSFAYLEQNLNWFLQNYEPLSSYAFPLLGAGLGGLKPDQVTKYMQKKLLTISGKVDIDIHIP